MKPEPHMKQDSPAIEYIDTQSQLEKFCHRIADVAWLAFDTEFIREKTYFPQLCLIQIASADETICVDPLSLDDLSPLLEIIYNDKIQKVLHAGRQDLEILYHLKKQLPKNIFDTQLAAPFLGYTEQLSYANVVLEFTGVNLNKSQTRTDWKTRPLSKEQIQYAANDVFYLTQVFRHLKAQLENHGRLDWAQREFDKLTDENLYELDSAEMWKKIRGYDRLQGPQLALLQALAAWREETARRMDLPRNWVIKDDITLEIAKQTPRDIKALRQMRGITDKIVHHYGERIMQVIEEAKNKPQPLLPQKKPVKLNHEESALVDILMSLVRRCGVEHQINPNMIANRKELEKFIVNDHTSKLAKGWRHDLIGQQLRDVLDGSLCLSIQSNKIELLPK